MQPNFVKWTCNAGLKLQIRWPCTIITLADTVKLQSHEVEEQLLVRFCFEFVGLILCYTDQNRTMLRSSKADWLKYVLLSNNFLYVKQIFLVGCLWGFHFNFFTAVARHTPQPKVQALHLYRIKEAQNFLGPQSFLTWTKRFSLGHEKNL